MSDNKNIDQISGTETTGHEWDGIEELNTPMPRWWLYLFYASIVFAVIYGILMPSLPGYRGVLGQSARSDVIQDVESLKAERSQMMNQLTNASLDSIRQNDTLFEYAMAAGRSAFGDNCATCHGSGAQGFRGYPNLNDDVWLWGGTFDDIHQTITYGIRAPHDETRYSAMLAFGNDGLLNKAQINDLVQYVLSLSGKATDTAAAQRASSLFQSQCASCHGTNGQGDRTQGAPNLADADWLYGGEADNIYQTIYYGRQGVMPNWNERLSPEMITALSVYVYELGGGEDSPIAQ